jgi:hypothetical protein
MEGLNRIVAFLMQSLSTETTSQPSLALDLARSLDQQAPAQIFANLNTAFLIALAEDHHPQSQPAKAYLIKLASHAEWSPWATFYLHSLDLISTEIQQACQQDADLDNRFQQLSQTLAQTTPDNTAIAEAIWAVFFPEGVGIRGQKAQAIEQLRQQRMVTIQQLNPQPIDDPSQQILFTSNALLTTPLPGTDLSTFDADLQAQLTEAIAEPQLYWYDHPIPIGVPSENNEILYGLKHLNAAMEFEHQRHPDSVEKATCVLSVSVTHQRLQTLGKRYLKQVLADSDPLQHLNIFAFTEADTEALIHQVLLPIANHCCPDAEAEELLSVFGVDGRYGRHYSFLKAIAAIWQVLIDPAIQATFKIDLDQVFPQTELVEQTGASALEHLQTPLWGAAGIDHWGNPVELGMIAGALVNQKDIHQGIFTPDVTIPEGDLQPDEYVFFSKLPQAISTQAEMMTRYAPNARPDGTTTCLQRIHVTGGTNGIRVETLRRYQPFTPSFIGRAEDQAYILSALHHPQKLAYAHASGLIMRHDKEGFAQEAIAMAKVGKQIGDYVRILMFSAYAQALPLPTSEIKTITQPFTGGFISQLPVTVALLRFSLKVASLFQSGKTDEAVEFITTGVPQLQAALQFTQGNPSQLQRAYAQERRGWQLFYQALDAVEAGLQQQEPWALEVQAAAQKIVANCQVN